MENNLQSMRPGELARGLSQFRQTVFRQAADAVVGFDGSTPSLAAESFPRVAALLASALEELRVAEEELLEQHDTLAAERDSFVRDVGRERRLFDLAPCALFVTDLFAQFLDANRAMLAFLRTELSQLEGKPLVSLVPLDERKAFRDALGRLSVTEGATNWRFSLQRRRDVAMDVLASVHVVPGGNKNGGVALYWALRPATD
jgi:PAS domain-containing protein